MVFCLKKLLFFVYSLSEKRPSMHLVSAAYLGLCINCHGLIFVDKIHSAWYGKVGFRISKGQPTLQTGPLFLTSPLSFLFSVLLQDGRFVAMATKDLQTLNLKFDQVIFNSLVFTWKRNFQVTFGIFSVSVSEINVL